MKKTRRSILAAVMAFALLLGLMPALTPSAEAAGTDGGIKIMDGVTYSPKLLLGKTGTVIVKLQNGSGAPRYNIDIVLTPPTGVSAGKAASGTSGTTLLSSPAVDTKTNTITYSDLFDLAANETKYVEIPLTVAQSATLGTENNTLNIAVNSSASAYDSATQGGLTDTYGLSLDIVPVLVKVTDVYTKAGDFYDTTYSLGDRLKGAGETDAMETSGTYANEGNYSYDNTITLTNNGVGATKVDLKHVVPNGVQVTGITVSGGTISSPETCTVDSTTSFNRSYDWNVTLAADTECTITYKNNIFDKYTTGTGTDGAPAVNSGARITDGTDLNYSTECDWTYPATSAEGTTSVTGKETLAQTARAKDIVIGKGVTAPSDGFAADHVVTYPITVSTAQYHSVNNIVVTDTLGDGLEYSDFTDNSDKSVKVKSSDTKDKDGKQLVILTSFDMGAGQSAKFTLTAKILANWALGNNKDKPISAMDILRNVANVSGTVTPAEADGTGSKAAYTASSGDDAEIQAPSPKVTKEMVSIGANNSPAKDATDETYHLAVDDSFVVRYTYDASAVKVPQKNVVLTDFYPLSSELDSSVTNVSVTVNKGEAKTVSLGTVSAGSYDVKSAFNTATNLSANSVTFGDGTTAGHTSFSASFASLPAETKIVVEYTLKVKDTKDVTDAKKDFSMAKLSFTDTNGAAFSARQQFPICFDAPVLGITHTVADGSNNQVTALTGVTGGEDKTFTVTVKNTGHKPAYNVGVKVTLPAGLTAKTYTGFTA